MLLSIVLICKNDQINIKNLSIMMHEEVAYISLTKSRSVIDIVKCFG